MAQGRSSSHISESEWLQELQRVRSGTSVPGYWENLEKNCDQWASEISVGPFWAEAAKCLKAWIGEHRAKTGGALLVRPGLPRFVGKGADRIRTKLYQKRLKQENFRFEAFPKDGPPIPQLNDLVRTRISCQYIDGVEFLAHKLFNLAEMMKLTPKHSREGRLEGYFAQHITFTSHVYYRFARANIPACITCEVQLATELSTRIWEATHSIYADAREKEEEPEDWQWNPKDPRFVSRQLGHMIHLADGLLVQLREAVTLGRAQRGK